MRRFLAPPALRGTLLALAVAFAVAAGVGTARACPPSCDDLDPCTTDSCDAGTDTCLHDPVVDGTGCDDNNACTTGDACQAGVCVGGPAPSCDDANPCTDDICDSSLGCLHANNNAPCSDANVCTGCPAGTCGPVGAGDVCNGGVCVGGNTAPGCDACVATATIPPLGGAFAGTTFGASGLSGSCAVTDGAPERVYVWIPDAGGQATISTCGSGTAFNTVLYLRNGDCTSGAEDACNDDTSGCTIGDGTAHGSTIKPLVVAGQPYYIVVDGKNGAAGRFTLTVKPASICGNDVREGLEQCDGAANSGCCIGKVCQPCAADCTCTPPPDGLPDLAPELRDISVEFGGSVSSGDVAEGCAERATGLDLLHFSVRSRNIGTADFYLGPSLCPSPCSAHPLAVCANPEFVCSPSSGHNHAHYTNFARYDLLDADGTALVVGHKQGFCMRDDSTCGQPKYDCNNQGLTAGCFDDYYAALGCQYLDVTGIPPGNYSLRVTIDPFQRISELDESNNVVTVAVTIPAPSTTTTSTTVSTTSSTSSTETSTSSTIGSSTSSETSTSSSTTSTTDATSSTTVTTSSSTSTSTSSTSSTTSSTTSTSSSTTTSSSSSTSSTSSSTTTSSTSSTSTTNSPPAPTTSTSTSTSTTSSTLPTAVTTSTLAPTTTSSSTTVTSTSTTTTSTVPPGSCSAPVVLPAEGGAITATTKGTSGLTGTCAYTNAAPERVFQWTAPRSGVATIQTCDGKTNFDTVLYVRQTACASGTQVSCNDDTQGCGTTLDGGFPRRGSRVTPTVTAGRTYFIVVDGYATARGTFQLTVSPPPGKATVRRRAGAKVRPRVLRPSPPALLR